jgi:hypothetical protein
VNRVSVDASQRSAPSRRLRGDSRPAFRRVAVTACVCAALGLLILVRNGASQEKPKAEKTRAARVRTGTQIGVVAGGLFAFSERIGHLPYPIWRESFPANPDVSAPNGTGRPLGSWRNAIISTLMDWHGPYDDTQSWDRPANRAALCFSHLYTYDEAKDWVANGKLFPDANILAITGPGTAFGYDRGESPKPLETLPSSTIIAVEVRASGIPWPAPGDFDIRTMPRTICAPDGKGISSRLPGGFFVVFADAKVWFLSDKTPFETLKKLFTIEEAKKYDREKLLGPYVIDRGPYWEEAEKLGYSLLDSAQAWHKRGMEEWKKEQEKAKKPGQ